MLYDLLLFDLAFVVVEKLNDKTSGENKRKLTMGGKTFLVITMIKDHLIV